MPIDLYLSILKPFIIPLGFTATATICLLMILKNYLRGYLLCQRLSWQNFSFYFVLNLDTGPFTISIAYKFHTFLFFGFPQLLTLSLFSLQFEGIYIQQKLIKSKMKYSVLIRPRLHWSFTDNNLFKEILCILQRSEFGFKFWRVRNI